MLPYGVHPQGIFSGSNMLTHRALMGYVVDVFLCVLHNSHLSQVLIPTDSAMEVHFVFALFIDGGHHVDELLFNAMLSKGHRSLNLMHLHVFLQLTFNYESFKALVTSELNQVWIVDFGMVLKCFPQ